MVIRSRKIKRTRTVCVDDAHRGWNDTKVPVCVYTHTAYVHYSNRAPPSLHLIVQCPVRLRNPTSLQNQHRHNSRSQCPCSSAG